MSDVPADRDLLRARAERLRIPVVAPADPESSLEVILFTLAGESYAIGTGDAGEVFSAEGWTALPGTPPFMPGAANFRGRIVPIVDLRPLFGLPAPGPGPDAKIILLEDRDSPLGILAESVIGIEVLDRAEIQPPPPEVDFPKAAYIAGIAPGHRIVFDASAILKDGDLSMDMNDIWRSGSGTPSRQGGIA